MKKQHVKNFQLWEQEDYKENEPSKKVNLTQYILGLSGEDVKVIDGEISAYDFEQECAAANFEGGGSFSTHITLDTPKYEIKFEVIGNASGGSDYGFVDPEIEVEMFIDGVKDKKTGEMFAGTLDDDASSDTGIQSLLGIY